jgi:hypothetical protein
MFRAAFIATACMASPAFAQVTIAENGIQIAVPAQGFSLYTGEEFFMARLWVHDNIERFSITIMDKQDPENTYTGMDWDERGWDPIISQDADIKSYYQGEGWMIAEGEVAGNGFYQRSVIKEGCRVIATLIVEYPRDFPSPAQAEFTRLAESLAIAPSSLCP